MSGQGTPDGTRLKVLFLDDEALIVDTFVLAAQVAGMEAVGFANPELALECFRSDPDGIHAVITDYTMPQLGCMEFVTRLREIRPDVSVHLCTGNPEHEIQEAGRRLGIRSVLYKPFDYDTLEAFLKRVAEEEGRSS